MSIYQDKLAHVQVIINCQYSVAQMCTREDTLAHILGAPCLSLGIATRYFYFRRSIYPPEGFDPPCVYRKNLLNEKLDEKTHQATAARSIRRYCFSSYIQQELATSIQGHPIQTLDSALVYSEERTERVFCGQLTHRSLQIQYISVN